MLNLFPSFICLSLLILTKIGLMAKRNKSGERTSPCGTPDCVLNVLENSFLNLTLEILSRLDCMMLINSLPNPFARRVLKRYLWLTLSNAFLKSINNAFFFT